MEKLQPLGDRVVIKTIEQEEVTKTGIVLPDTAKEKPQEGKVIAVGPGKLADDGKNYVFITSKESQIGPGYTITCAVNATGKGDTIKIGDYSTTLERLVFPSDKLNNTGIGYGRPQLNKFKAQNITEGQLCHVLQAGKTDGYWFTNNTDLIQSYLVNKYKKIDK